LADPQTPLIIRFAEQLAVVPVFCPLQFHVQGPVPETVLADPAEQRLVTGADDRLAPFDEPHDPLIIKLAEQLAVDPPLLPLQDHVQGPDPKTVVADPAEQRLVVGADDRLAPFDEPQVPLIGVGALLRLAEQLAVEPPLLPLQDHEVEPPWAGKAVLDEEPTEH
jgi:hypothetical protein